MSPTQPLPALAWTVVEAGDRWFQAVLRFTTASVPQERESIQHLNIAAANELTSRWDADDARVRIVLWEVPVEPQAWLPLIDVIANVRRSGAHVVQLAHLRSPESGSAALAVQEAGVTVLVDELWMLEKLACQMTSRMV